MNLIFVDYGYALGGIWNPCRRCTNLPLLRQYYRLKSGIFVLHAGHRGTAGGVSEIDLLFWCRYRYLGVVIGDKGLSLIKLSFPPEDAEGRVISSCEIFSEEISRIVTSISEISITSRFLSNIKMIVIMRRSLVRLDISKIFHSLQINAKSINFTIYMLVGIFHIWLTKLNNDQNNRQESREVSSSWFN